MDAICALPFQAVNAAATYLVFVARVSLAFALGVVRKACAWAWWATCLPYNGTLYALTWVACLVGVCLSAYGYAKVLMCTARRGPRLREALETSGPAKVSVVVGAYNEERNIARVLRMLDSHATEREAVEVIVVDGNSTDGTCDKVKATPVRLPVRLLSGVTGRGTTQNAGAAAATGDILLFLHADTQLPLGYDHMIREAVRDPGVVAGAFSFAVDTGVLEGPVPTGLSTMAAFAQWRSVTFQLPYGDQALFMTKGRWADHGPFPDSIMMEDFHLMGALRQAAVAEGGRVVTLPAPALCSPRRWEKNGVPWNTFLNQAFVFAYTVLGLPSSRIYEWYYGTKLPAAVHARDAAVRAERERLASLAATAKSRQDLTELARLRARASGSDGALAAREVWRSSVPSLPSVPRHLAAGDKEGYWSPPRSSLRRRGSPTAALDSLDGSDDPKPQRATHANHSPRRQQKCEALLGRMSELASQLKANVSPQRSVRGTPATSRSASPA